RVNAQAQAQATASAQAAAAAAARAAQVKELGCRDLAGLQVCVTLIARSSGDSFSILKQGQEFATFRITYANNSTRERAFNPNDLDLVDGVGVVKTYEWLGPEDDAQRLGAGALVPG